MSGSISNVWDNYALPLSIGALSGAGAWFTISEWVAAVFAFFFVTSISVYLQNLHKDKKYVSSTEMLEQEWGSMHTLIEKKSPDASASPEEWEAWRESIASQSQILRVRLEKKIARTFRDDAGGREMMYKENEHRWMILGSAIVAIPDTKLTRDAHDSRSTPSEAEAQEGAERASAHENELRVIEYFMESPFVEEVGFPSTGKSGYDFSVETTDGGSYLAEIKSLRNRKPGSDELQSLEERVKRQFESMDANIVRTEFIPYLNALVFLAEREEKIIDKAGELGYDVSTENRENEVKITLTRPNSEEE